MRFVAAVLLTAVTLSCHSDDGKVEPVKLYDEDLKYAQVVEVTAEKDTSGTWRFDVTVRHQDEGWDHYANIWQVVDPTTEEVYGERVLAHPHDNEQPFTRSLSGVDLPPCVTTVVIRARCNLHGYSGRTVQIDLPSG